MGVPLDLPPDGRRAHPDPSCRLGLGQPLRDAVGDGFPVVEVEVLEFLWYHRKVLSLPGSEGKDFLMSGAFPRLNAIYLQ